MLIYKHKLCKSSAIDSKFHIILSNDNRAGVNSNFAMARRKRNVHLSVLAGFIAGVLLGYLVKICLKNVVIFNSRTLELNGVLICPRGNRKFGSVHRLDEQTSLDPLKIIGIADDKETIHNSKRSLLFVGVMTADKYLKSRAAAVYRTWGKDLPGRLAFFSSGYSRSSYLPLVSLRGVDDSYPPQKKSFMMMLYMHDNYIDRFEWFLRADDDVYIKADKLEALLRSVDSRRAQFIGQAGRGNSEEFGSLSLEYDENFCMGGPGVILSRETLKRIAPHIKECLKNLYTTHEDVELGRCVQKYAGVPCTWSYEMQSILYHNSSGTLAFTGNLKKREVHHAITMHPVKDHRHMFRINTYLKNLKIQDLKEVAISLHRDILIASKELDVESNSLSTHLISDSVRLFPNLQGHPGYLGDTNILGVSPNLNRYHPTDVKNVLTWSFFTKMVFSPDNSNPKRRLEVSMVEGLDDIIRELMEIINAYSKQRGRVIEFSEILYGYQRLDPIHGADYILDILLVYKKYRGRKMTVSVRRHAYLQQSFTGIEIRELPLGESPVVKLPKNEINQEYDVDRVYQNEDVGAITNNIPFLNFKKLNVPIRDVLENSLMKISESLPNVFKSYINSEDSYKKTINFILPLSGRYNTLIRFMNNFEQVCLLEDRRTALIITLYNDVKNLEDYEKTIKLIELYIHKYPYSEIKLIEMNDSLFSRGISLLKGIELCKNDSLLFFVDVDITFTAESLQRIRLNTIQNYKVYFPIVFSEYDPQIVNGKDYNVIRMKQKFKNNVILENNEENKNMQLKGTDLSNEFFAYNYLESDNHGYYRQFGFGIVSVFKSDFLSVGGFNTEIKGWGLEDVHLFEKFVQSNITILRSVDPGLVHVFHPVDCDKNLDLAQYNMCIGTRANTFGSIKHMLIYMLNNPAILPSVKPSTVSNKPKVVP